MTPSSYLIHSPDWIKQSCDQERWDRFTLALKAMNPWILRSMITVIDAYCQVAFPQVPLRGRALTHGITIQADQGQYNKETDRT